MSFFLKVLSFQSSRILFYYKNCNIERLRKKKSYISSPDSSQMNFEAQKLKQLGNNAYKKRDFAIALGNYGKAIDQEPTEIQ